MKPRGHGVFIGRFFGIDFFLDYSWFLIAGIVTSMLALRFFPQALPGHGPVVYVMLGAIAASLFFLSILLHELGHSLVSQRCGIPVPRILLLFIGGIAHISREPDDAKSELKIALGGPAVSLLLVLIYKGLGVAFVHLHAREMAVIFNWLSFVNIVLVLFNAFPGYPLDGGRVLRALLWLRSGDFRRATYVATRFGIVFAYALMLLGVLALFYRQWNALVLFVIGIFLRKAATKGYERAVRQELPQNPPPSAVP
ncbi:MAG: hypothetical protein QOD99_993 [Chthoniobacter sp.]|nr:hypothetical protein [Chthoniobacter sp.]